ncbi:FtsX-like permease family protein [Kutzneria chonburiensis]|uniref:FtsX-like permease family protein n=1 Tax=Kutzneria chonburiensis TaxID=1483604 RepID=A0ABV6N9R6_9PSEU|nr:FtsX-like permease family protein [Kutzneria chonburiensis]
MTVLRLRPRRRTWQWWIDLTLGVRLAVGGGRAGWGRLALTAIGVGLGVAVLLTATSVSHMLQARDDHGYGRAVPLAGQAKVAGVDPVYAAMRSSEFNGSDMDGVIVQKTGPNAPLPPGVDRLPNVGEILLSPALQQLLNSPDGALLRPRFPERVIGTVNETGLTGPHELFFYVGVAKVAGQSGAAEVYEFGRPSEPRKLDGLLWLLIALGSAALLMPVVVFVATSTRLAAAARDRRLAALRLVGADGKQVRRIAAGEAFVGALVGLAVGVALFAVGRSIVPMVDTNSLRGGIFAADIRPDWTLAALIVVVVPLLAVLIAMFSLRRVMIEPLGVVRRARNQRRRLWWRLLPPTGGIALLASQRGTLGDGLNQGSQLPVMAGIVLLLSSVPLVLPWLVERVVAKLGGGSPAWQLAVRRLQLDSGTPARVVGGVAVVLVGGIALQTLLVQANTRYEPPGEKPPPVSVNMPAVALSQALALDSALRKVPGTESVTPSITMLMKKVGGSEVTALHVGTCADVRQLTSIDQCRDGDVFVSAKPYTSAFVPAAGERVSFFADDPRQPVSVDWTMPAEVKATTALTTDMGLVYATPGALAGVTAAVADANASVQPKANDANYVEYVRNALEPFGWSANAFTPINAISSTFELIARVLLIGSVITLLLAAASLLVVALEQIRERRRALAVLAANGVRRSVLARSLLWQTAVPIAMAVAVALVAGLVLGGMVLTVSNQPIVFDWATIALFVATAVIAVLASTVCTLPALWRAANAEGLRDE